MSSLPLIFLIILQVKTSVLSIDARQIAARNATTRHAHIGVSAFCLPDGHLSHNLQQGYSTVKRVCVPSLKLAGGALESGAQRDRFRSRCGAEGCGLR
jgi:hypothetical protein